jgi:glycosyltransferase involved in cell wall biosynthesis
MPRKLKIACVGTRGLPSNYSGIETACDSLYTELAKRGHDITVYCRARSGSSENVYRGIELKSIPALESFSLGTLTHAGASLAVALASKRFDLIHLHALAPGLFSRVCRVAGVSTIATVHGLDWKRAKWSGLGSKVLKLAERSLVQNVTRIVVVSRDLARYFESTYERNVTYIPNGIEDLKTTRLDSSVSLAAFNLRPEGFVLYFGRLVPEKRIHDLILAFRELKTDDKLVITGELANGGAYVKRLIALAGKDPRIVFTGHQGRSVVNALAANAAAYVSTSELEGMPMSLLEAVSLGAPAVVTNIAPHLEILGEIPSYDLFFSPGDVVGLRLLLEHVLDNKKYYRAVAQKSRAFFSEAYSWNLIADRTEQVFYDALEDSAGRQVTALCPRERRVPHG